MVLDSRNKKFFLILAVFLFTMMIGISMVSATSNTNTTDNVLSTDNTVNTNTVSLDDNSINNIQTNNNNQVKNLNTSTSKTIKSDKDSITSWNELRSYMKYDGTYTLSSNLIADSQLTTYEGRNVTINGNGFNITFESAGQINVVDNSVLNILDITLDGSTTDRSTSGIKNQGNLTIENSIIQNFVNGGSGGAITSNDESKYINNTFINNQGTNGGAIYITGSNIIFINNTFTNNKASSSAGGAIYNCYASNNRYINNTFNSNKATTSGGAIYSLSGENNTYSDNKFNSNIATTSGGAIYDLYGENNTYNDNHFNSNCANQSGGAIYDFITENNTYSSNNFDSNYANQSGGAIYNKAVKNCNYTNNTLIGNNATYGGAIYDSDSTDCNSINNSFTSNNATYGGAVYNNNGENYNFINNSFTSNNVTYGGAVYNNNGENYNFINNSFTSNNATYGGAIFNDICVNYLYSGNNFTDNKAKTNGSAMYNNGSTDSKIVENTFNSNFVINGETLYMAETSDVVANNSYFNNSIVFSNKTITSKVNGSVSIIANITLTNPDYYDSDILNKTDYTIYFDGINNKISITERGSLTYNTTLPGDKYNISETLSIAQSTGDNYKTTSIVDLKVIKSTNSTIIANDIIYKISGNMLKVNGTVENLTSGTLNVNITNVDGKVISNETATVDENGNWNKTYSNLAIGKYNITVIFEGDEYHLNFTNSTTVSVIKQPANSTIRVGNVTYPRKIIVSGILANITRGNLNISIIKDDVQVASQNYTINGENWNVDFTGLNASEYMAVVSYTNDTYDFADFTNSTKFSVYCQPANSTISVNNVTYPENVTVSGKLANITSGDLNISIKKDNVTVASQNYSINGKEWSVDFTGLNASEYEAIVSYINNTGNYVNFINTTTFKVEKQSANSTIVADVNFENVTVSGVLANITSGDLNVSIIKDDVQVASQNYPINGTNWSVEFASLNTGEYKAIVSYTNSTGNFIEFANTTTFKVDQLTTNLTVDDIEPVEIYDDFTIKGTLVDELNNPLTDREIIVSINGINETTKTNEDGKYNFTTVATTTGINNITVIFAGETNYASSKANTTVNVKSLSSIDVEVLEPVVIVGDNVVIVGTLEDMDGNAITNAKIILTIDGVNYTNTTNAEGLYTYNYKTSTVKDEVKVIATFEGNDNFTGRSEKTTFEVDKMSSEVIVDDIENTLVNSTVFVTGQLVHEYDTSIPIANAEITVVSNGVTYNGTTDSKGKFNIKTIAPSTEKIVGVTVTFKDNDLYYGSDAETSYDVEKYSTNITVENIETITIYDNITVKGTLVDETGKSLAGRTIIVSINGNNNKTTTDNYGKYSYSTRATTAGINNITVSYEGDSGYASSDAITTVNVKSITSITVEVSKSVVAVGANEVITGKLTDINGKIIANAEIVLTIDGVNYTNTTNTKGLYTYNYKTNTVKNAVEVVATFNGNNNFTASSNKTTFNVEKMSSKITVNQINNTVINSTVYVTGQLVNKNTNVPIANADITVKSNNITYSGTTNSEGKYNIKTIAPSTKQTVKITVKFDGNQEYDTSNATTIYHIKQYNTKITVDSVTAKVNDNITITAHIIDENNNEVNGGVVVFKVNGKTLTDNKNNTIKVTVVNGVANITTQALKAWTKEGSYITAVYGGNEIYTASRSENVELSISLRTANIKIVGLSNITVKGGNTVLLMAYVTDNGKIVQNGVVNFKINGKTFIDSKGNVILVKVVNGIAQLEYKLTDGMSAKDYNITAVYVNYDYNRAEANSVLHVVKSNTKITSKSIVTNTTGISKLNVTVTDENNKLVVGTTEISIKMNGKTIYNRVTITNGTGTFNITTPNKQGIYNITIIAGETSSYNPSRLNTALIKTVTTKINTKITSKNITANTSGISKLNIKVTDENNKLVVGTTKISVKMNGKTIYNKTRITNGTGTFNITNPNKQGIYNITIIAGETNTYNSSKLNVILNKTVTTKTN